MSPKEMLYHLYWNTLERYAPDRVYLSLLFKRRLGYKMNWANPQTFNEKIQWMKLYDRNPLYSQYADKVAVRDFVSTTIGEEYLIPSLGVYYTPNDIDFETLPNRFVLKCNHGAGYNIICKDKSTFDIERAKAVLNFWLKEKFYRKKREYHYKAIKPMILCEQYMEDKETGSLNDYKVFMINGEVYMIQVDYDRFHEHTRNLYDKNWNLLDVEISFPCHKEHLTPKPAVLEKMLDCAKRLAGSFPEVRVDFYVINGKLYFSEMTFFSGAGFSKYNPPEFERIMGKQLHIPELEQMRVTKCK